MTTHVYPQRGGYMAGNFLPYAFVGIGLGRADTLRSNTITGTYVGTNAANGVSTLPRPTVVMESGMRTLATVPVALPGLARPIGIIYRRGKQMPPAVSRFIEVLRKADGARVPAGVVP